jgi:hypothetical protein
VQHDGSAYQRKWEEPSIASSSATGNDAFGETVCVASPPILSQRFRTKCCRGHDAGSSAGATLEKARAAVTRDQKIRLAVARHGQEEGIFGVMCLEGRHQWAQHDRSLLVVDHGAHQVRRQNGFEFGIATDRAQLPSCTSDATRSHLPARQACKMASGVPCDDIGERIKHSY